MVWWINNGFSDIFTASNPKYCAIYPRMTRIWRRASKLTFFALKIPRLNSTRIPHCVKLHFLSRFYTWVLQIARKNKIWRSKLSTPFSVLITVSTGSSDESWQFPEHYRSKNPESTCSHPPKLALHALSYHVVFLPALIAPAEGGVSIRVRPFTIDSSSENHVEALLTVVFGDTYPETTPKVHILALRSQLITSNYVYVTNIRISRSLSA